MCVRQNFSSRVSSGAGTARATVATRPTRERSPMSAYEQTLAQLPECFVYKVRSGVVCWCGGGRGPTEGHVRSGPGKKSALNPTRCRRARAPRATRPPTGTCRNTCGPAVPLSKPRSVREAFLLVRPPTDGVFARRARFALCASKGWTARCLLNASGTRTRASPLLKRCWIPAATLCCASSTRVLTLSGNCGGLTANPLPHRSPRVRRTRFQRAQQRV